MNQPNHKKTYAAPKLTKYGSLEEFKSSQKKSNNEEVLLECLEVIQLQEAAKTAFV